MCFIGIPATRNATHGVKMPCAGFADLIAMRSKHHNKTKQRGENDTNFSCFHFTTIRNFHSTITYYFYVYDMIGPMCVCVYAVHCRSYHFILLKLVNRRLRCIRTHNNVGEKLFWFCWFVCSFWPVARFQSGGGKQKQNTIEIRQMSRWRDLYAWNVHFRHVKLELAHLCVSINAHSPTLLNNSNKRWAGAVSRWMIVFNFVIVYLFIYLWK